MIQKSSKHSTPYVLERTIANRFGFEYAVMFGRARSGLVALIEILRTGSERPFPVLLPENICPVLVSAIQTAGGKTVTVPVSPMTGLPDDQSFVEVMKQCHDVGIVMPTHLYGFQTNYPETIKYARQNGWFILENDTNVVQMDNQEKVFGDALLLSFGYAKPIEVGAGGALLTNDISLALNLQKQMSSYGVLHEKTQTLEAECMMKRRAMRGQLDVNSDDLKQICRTEQSLCRFQFDKKLSELLLSKLDQFPDERKRRQESRILWDESLKPLDKILEPIPLKQPVPWRIMRRAPNGRDYLAKALWNQNMDAGINYRSLWREMPPSYLSGYLRKEKPTSDIWGDVVLNLWVTEEYDRNKIEQAVNILSEAAHDQKQ
ncbi:MAG: DegT/DnrJ/EryC1/StrS family aminotransferase [Emcibacter sp.]|nr:DegT/DnrJ/EryC1/StrS family aminotransferase [Emcibacter sp.]